MNDWPPVCDYCGAELTVTLPADDGGTFYKGCDDETMRCVDCMTPEQRQDAARALDFVDEGGRIRTQPAED
jgi:hypothetical protein